MYVQQYAIYIRITCMMKKRQYSNISNLKLSHEWPDKQGKSPSMN